MSVLVWHKGQMYTDSCIDGSSDIKVTKLIAPNHVRVLGGVGHMCDLNNFFIGKPILDDHSIVLEWSGNELLVHSSKGTYPIDHTRTVAYGSGADIFLGAIATGVSVGVALSITEQISNSVAAPFHTVQGGEILAYPVSKFSIIEELK